MKIAIIHHFYNENSSSGENVVVSEQIDSLKRAGHQVKTFSTQGAEIGSLYQKVKTGINLSFGKGVDFQVSIDDFNPDLIHVHNTFPAISTSAIAKLRYPKVVTLHNFRFVCANGTLFRNGHECNDCIGRTKFPALLHKCYRESSISSLPVVISQNRNRSHIYFQNFQRVITVNDEIINMLARDGVRGFQSSVLPNYIADPSVEHRQLSRSGYVFCGRLTREKGISWLVQRWPENGSVLDVFGTGPEENQISVYARANIRFRGQVDRGLLLKSLSSYRALILPSMWPEGSPLVVIEALALGLPVLAHKNTSIGKRLAAEDSGLVFDDEYSLNASISEVENNYDFYSANARRFYLRHHSEQEWIRQIEAIYEEAIVKFHSEQKQN